MLKKKVIFVLVFSFFILINLNCSSTKDVNSDNPSVEKQSSNVQEIPKATVTKAPQLFVSPSDKYIFKDVEEGTIVEFEWELKNIGTDTLYINDVESSCGCTAAIPDTKSIPPQSSTKLKVKFDTHNRLGINTKFVTVFSNDSKSPNKVLTLEGRVLQKKTK